MIRKKILKYTAVCVIFICSAEVAGILFSKGIRNVGYDDARTEKEEKLALLPAIQSQNRVQDPRVYLNNIPREIHPYFGFTLQRDYRSVNNHGFPAKSDYPYRSAANEFVVGIFGGSVSMGQAVDKKSRRVLEDGLHDILESNGFDKVTVLCLGSGGWRQPQTFYAFVYFLDMLDMAIVVDGFNDVNFVTKDQARNWPLRYPWKRLYQMLANPDVSPGSLQTIGEISFLNKIIVQWTSLFSWPVVDRSLFLHSVWKIVADRLDARIQSKRLALDQTVHHSLTYTTIAAKSAEEAEAHVDDYFDFYHHLSLWQAVIARKENMPYFHFIQPNQYVRNSKPYSRTERGKSLSRGEDQFEKITAYYERLEDIVQQLSRAGVQVYSLVDIFRHTKNTIYRDDCCHLNQQGKVAVATRMLQLIETGLPPDANGQKTFGDQVVRKRVRRVNKKIAWNHKEEGLLKD